MDLNPVINYLEQQIGKLSHALELILEVHRGPASGPTPLPLPAPIPPSSEVTPAEKAALLAPPKVGKAKASGQAKNPKLILDYLMKNPDSKAKDIAAALGLPRTTIGYYLSQGHRARALEMHGKAHFATWSVAQKLRKAEPEPRKTAAPPPQPQPALLPGRFRCEPCRATFTNEQIFKEHMASRHPGESVEPAGETKYPCDECERVFASETGLAAHKERSH